MMIGVVYREHRKWEEKAQWNKVGEERLKVWLNRQEQQMLDKKYEIKLGNCNTVCQSEQEPKYEKKRMRTLLKTRMKLVIGIW